LALSCAVTNTKEGIENNCMHYLFRFEFSLLINLEVNSVHKNRCLCYIREKLFATCGIDSTFLVL